MASSFSLKILIDEEKNKVLFAQAGKDFIDILLSFLTLPLGTIARLLNKESNHEKVRFGSISSLYESVSNLDEKHFWTSTCKEMLLRPRNPMEEYCQNLNLNIDDTKKMKYFICENWHCSRKSSGGLLTTFSNQTCSCGKSMNREIMPSSSVIIIEKKIDINESATFIISEELSVKPDSFQNSVCEPMNLLGLEDWHAIKLVTVNVTHKEILELLEYSLFSTTPLTDVFLLKKQLFENPKPITDLDFDITNLEAIGEGHTTKLKVILRKSNNTLVFALGGDDFVDFIFSFLTFPLGRVEHMFKGNCCGTSIDNLYNSMLDLDSNTYFRSPDLKEKLVKPQLAHQFKLCNQIIPIDEKPSLNYFCVSKFNTRGGYNGFLTKLENCGILPNETLAPLSYLEPQSCVGEVYSNSGGRGFTKRPSLYMVTNDLIVTPTSAFSVISSLSKLGIPPHDFEERVINIGIKEGLRLLKASMISSLALTSGLGPFHEIKIENSQTS